MVDGLFRGLPLLVSSPSVKCFTKIGHIIWQSTAIRLLLNVWIGSVTLLLNNSLALFVSSSHSTPSSSSII